LPLDAAGKEGEDRHEASMNPSKRGGQGRTKNRRVSFPQKNGGHGENRELVIIEKEGPRGGKGVLLNIRDMRKGERDPMRNAMQRGGTSFLSGTKLERGGVNHRMVKNYSWGTVTLL